MWGVELIFEWGSVIATVDKSPNSECLKFNTREEAERWAERNSGKALYCAFEIKKYGER